MVRLGGSIEARASCCARRQRRFFAFPVHDTARYHALLDVPQTRPSCRRETGIVAMRPHIHGYCTTAPAEGMPAQCCPCRAHHQEQYEGAGSAITERGPQSPQSRGRAWALAVFGGALGGAGVGVGVGTLRYGSLMGTLVYPVGNARFFPAARRRLTSKAEQMHEYACVDLGVHQQMLRYLWDRAPPLPDHLVPASCSGRDARRGKAKRQGRAGQPSIQGAASLDRALIKSSQVKANGMGCGPMLLLPRTDEAPERLSATRRRQLRHVVIPAALLRQAQEKIDCPSCAVAVGGDDPQGHMQSPSHHHSRLP